MKVLLIDCDWEEGVTLSPNPWLLKTSSFFKQTDNSVELSRGRPDVDRYDLVVVFKDKPTDYLPAVNILNNSKTKLHGDFFKAYPNYWKLSKNIFMARPDYYIYNDKHLLQQDYLTYSFRGELINSQPSIKNNKSLEDKVVIDNIWELDDEDLLAVIKDLRQYRKIHFLQPIDFLRFNEEIFENFVKLSYSKRQINSKKVFEVQLFREILNWVLRIKETRIFPLKEIMVIAANASEHSGARFMECVEMLEVANRGRMKIKFMVPAANFKEAPLFYYLRNYRQDISFIEYLVKTETNEDPLEVILNDRHYGFAVDLVRELHNHRKDVFNMASITWGGIDNIKLRENNT